MPGYAMFHNWLPVCYTLVKLYLPENGAKYSFTGLYWRDWWKSTCTAFHVPAAVSLSSQKTAAGQCNSFDFFYSYNFFDNRRKGNRFSFLLFDWLFVPPQKVPSNVENCLYRRYILSTLILLCKRVKATRFSAVADTPLSWYKGPK